ncbi:efflux RND transporter periplasmic adaptor subunit [bacterium]|nr:efflux RND transporter periplasmic adaptor subunit [bacterium]
MRLRSRKVVIPSSLLLVALVAVFLLGRFGVLDVPWTPESARASELADGEGKDGKDKEDEKPAIPVELALAEARRISAYYRASSVIEADRHVDLVSKSSGRVRAVNVEEGDWVERGQVLAELENDEQKILLRQGQLKEKDAKRELDRRKSLLAQNLITQEDFDATKSSYDLAVTDRELANVRVVDTQILAPFSGQVTRRSIVPGQHVNASEPAFTLVDLEPLRVRVHLPEVIARKVSPGDAVNLDVESMDTPVPATVERISPVVDPATSTVRLTLLVEQDARALRVGGFVKVRITTDTQTEALSIPKLALVEEGGLRSVFLAGADSVRKVEIRTGLYDESHIEVLDGLETGDYVVTLGQGGLRDGSHIDVLNATEVGWVPPVKEDDVEHADAGGGEGEDAADSGERNGAHADVDSTGSTDGDDGQAAVAMSDDTGQSG